MHIYQYNSFYSISSYNILPNTGILNLYKKYKARLHGAPKEEKLFATFMKSNAITSLSIHLIPSTGAFC